MDEIMSGQPSHVRTAAFLAALSAKGETVEEITACAAIMRAHAKPVQHSLELLEIVGTGGDGAHTINISTTSALVCAAGGIKVAKHGNRAASSKCGAADCLEALGVNISQSPAALRGAAGQRRHLLFLRAAVSRVHEARRARAQRDGRAHHLQHSRPAHQPRRRNHAGARRVRGAAGGADGARACNLGVKRGMVVYGQDKLDEISLSAPTTVCEFEGETFRTYEISRDFG